MVFKRFSLLNLTVVLVGNTKSAKKTNNNFLYATIAITTLWLPIFIFIIYKKYSYKSKTMYNMTNLYI